VRLSLSPRVFPYSILALVSVSLALVPCVLWPDFVAPYPDCTVVERTPTRIVLRCTLTAPLPPDYLAGEIRLFKVLVSPTVAPSLLGVWRPEYTRFAFPDGIITEAVAMLHPSELAIQYIRVAVPCWLLLGIVAYELSFAALRAVYRRQGNGRTPGAA
jgi:hypothetical protein